MNSKVPNAYFLEESRWETESYKIKSLSPFQTCDQEMIIKHFLYNMKENIGRTMLIIISIMIASSACF
ncbi:hypothetical protein Corgl_0925 [Coriobacterium glomerans PW2]|uniref:Uncharacterized protein n=1 Tax=Coriobacterium glomerans (strain ATCC 49209 / DSM 20642 / JCM 10262 / PW2) TaxID=700015 RepID=F2N9K7_CORGP|nr:hypothetical protein Corgl_0925 [Coriobacterium glomerans PW2]